MRPAGRRSRNCARLTGTRSRSSSWPGAIRADELEDLVQEFFLRWVRSRSWKRADRARGKFRTFLLGAVVHMLGHIKDREQAQKRGGGVEALSLEELHDDGHEFPAEPAAETHAYDRAWALAVIGNALAQVKGEYVERNKDGEFELLRCFLPGAGEAMTLDDAALRLGVNVNALKASVHRLRQRFRELLRATVARTVSAPHEVDEELAYLRSLLLMQPIVPTSGAEKRNIG